MDPTPVKINNGYDPQATETTQRRYQRNARFYDRMETGMEKMAGPWRKQLWALVKGPRVLEVGVGTGKNMPYYPEDTHITAIDLTSGMLERAQQRANEMHRPVQLGLGDVQRLDFPDAAFDSVTATFVFCSVPNPILGLQEIRRVLQPGGRVLLLEHVRSEKPIFGKLMDWLNPLVVRIMGANINRRTVENVRQSGLAIEQVEHLGSGDIFKLIIARRPFEITDSCEPSHIL
jgi:ubiquinone/menaquinone biosynthesis C-methylase UbiE